MRRVDDLSDCRNHERRLLRRRRLAETAWRLGPRAFYELLCELDRHHHLPDLDARLEKYAGADPAILHVFGGDRFPELPTRLVERRP
jgi:hypothetical protein